MVLANFFKLTIWINNKKFTYYGSDTDFINFNDKLKHEIIWKKQEKNSSVSGAEKQPRLF
jgi:hypothetical protein